MLMSLYHIESMGWTFMGLIKVTFAPVMQASGRIRCGESKWPGQPVLVFDIPRSTKAEWTEGTDTRWAICGIYEDRRISPARRECCQCTGSTLHRRTLGKSPSKSALETANIHMMSI